MFYCQHPVCIAIHPKSPCIAHWNHSYWFVFGYLFCPKQFNNNVYWLLLVITVLLMFIIQNCMCVIHTESLALTSPSLCFGKITKFKVQKRLEIFQNSFKINTTLLLK